MYIATQVHGAYIYSIPKVPKNLFKKKFITLDFHYYYNY
jgi:hypothetical protein